MVMRHRGVVVLLVIFSGKKKGAMPVPWSVSGTLWYSNVDVAHVAHVAMPVCFSVSGSPWCSKCVENTMVQYTCSKCSNNAMRYTSAMHI